MDEGTNDSVLDPETACPHRASWRCHLQRKGPFPLFLTNLDCPASTLLTLHLTFSMTSLRCGDVTFLYPIGGQQSLPKVANVVFLREPHPDPTVLLGQGLHNKPPGASAQDEGESNPPPFLREEEVQGEGISQGGSGPSALGPPKSSPSENILLPEGPHRKASSHMTVGSPVPPGSHGEGC